MVLAKSIQEKKRFYTGIARSSKEEKKACLIRMLKEILDVAFEKKRKIVVKFV